MSAAGERTVLLVEDSQTQALRVMAMLEGEGLAVRHVTSAEDALGELRSSRPDLILVDYHLPGMDGDEFCRQVRMSQGVESIPMLILTDDAREEVECRGLESGADDYVPKSMDPAAMIARLHAVMRNRKTMAGIGWHQPEAFRQARLLIVDDSGTYLVFLQALFEEDGYTVVSADSGEAALRAAREGSFDCVVMDLVMPGIDGIELCRRLDEFRRNAGLSLGLLMVTGRPSDEEMTKALDAGADDFVSKANDAAIIRARVRAMLRRKFLHDSNERILEAFRAKELEILRERSARETAQAKAELADRLEEANRELASANRELKEAQAQLVQTAKMASLGELVAGIAHEVNNPLAFVMNHIRTIDDRLSGIADAVEPGLQDAARRKWDKARERLPEALEGLERIRDIVVKLRTFSRLDEGEFKLVDMRDAIDTTIALIRHRAKDRVAIEVVHGDDGPLACYPGPLNQVIMNLVSNAIDAIEGTGTVTVRTWREEGRYCIAVADTGPGVPEHIRDRVFEPFFTTKPVGDGTGLGLAISYRIVESHKGCMRILDRPGGGAEFVVSIPTDLKDEGGK